MAFRTSWQRVLCTLTVLLLLLSQAGTAFADGGGHSLEQEVDGYHIQLVFEGQAVTGHNEVVVKLHDAQEQPVRAAQVKVFAQPAGEHSDEETGQEAAPSSAETGSAMNMEPKAEPKAEPLAEPMAEPTAAGPAMNMETQATQPTMGMEPMAQPTATEPAMSMESKATEPPMSMETKPTEPAMSMQPAAQPTATEPAMSMESAKTEDPTGSAAPEAHAEESGHNDEAMDNIVFSEGAEPGEYHGELALPEAGEWTVTVHFTTQDTKAQVHFNIEVTNRVNKTFILGGFAGINASVIVAAAVLKRRANLVKLEK